MITKLIRYYYYKIFAAKFIDFVDHGLGIEARFGRSKKQWQPHLTSCKNFLIDSIAGNSCDQKQIFKSICILGAGRLLDIPSERLATTFTETKLIDADPTCLPTWKNFQKINLGKVDWELVDISSRLEAWTNSLISYLNRKQEKKDRDFNLQLSSFLNSLLDQPRKPKWECPETDVLVSMNILSQLGIYWRDRVFSILNKYYPEMLKEDQIQSSEVENSLSKMAALLESEHLDLLAKSKAKLVILLYDDELYYYSKQNSKWQTESALSIQTEVALAGLSEQNRHCWLWHIVPQGSENKDYGEIHRVQARCFVKE